MESPSLVSAKFKERPKLPPESTVEKKAEANEIYKSVNADLTTLLRNLLTEQTRKLKSIQRSSIYMHPDLLVHNSFLEDDPKGEGSKKWALMDTMLEAVAHILVNLHSEAEYFVS